MNLLQPVRFQDALLDQTGHAACGAHSRDRTDDFILTMDALYLLSYASIFLAADRGVDPHSGFTESLVFETRPGAVSEYLPFGASGWI